MRMRRLLTAMAACGVIVLAAGAAVAADTVRPLPADELAGTWQGSAGMLSGPNQFVELRLDLYGLGQDYQTERVVMERFDRVES